MTEFSEAKGEWILIPKWVGFLLRFGYGWPLDEPRSRRLALISMPCDSAAAGLIALGALIRDLSSPRANDIDGHYDRLLDYARQYIESCRDCDLPDCDPQTKGCGYQKQATGIVRSASCHHKPHRVSSRTNVVERRLAFEYRNVTTWPNPQYLKQWFIDGEPPAEWSADGGKLKAEPYRQLVPEAFIHEENLRKSYSGLCFSGRSAGETASREVCASVRLRLDAVELGLEELLTVHNWSACSISRLAFFNPRTGAFDRKLAAPRLVISDGDASFLDAIDRPEFRKGDIVGVTHRIMERDKLEELGNKLSALRQWYLPDEDMMCTLPEVPRGISILILKRRT